MLVRKVTFFLFFQRPTAKELLRHAFIKRAKRNNHLMDLIDRYRKWRVTHSNESDSDSESDSDPQNNRYTCLMDLLSDDVTLFITELKFFRGFNWHLSK